MYGNKFEFLKFYNFVISSFVLVDNVIIVQINQVC